MDKQTAAGIGAKLAVKAMLYGLAIAYVMMACISAIGQGLPDLLWPMDWGAKVFLPAVSGAAIAVALAWLVGRLAGRCILIYRWNWALAGIMAGLLIPLSGTAVASGCNFLLHLHDDRLPYVIDAYLVRPILLVAFFGGIPMIAAGLWFGRALYNKGRELDTGVASNTF